MCTVSFVNTNDKIIITSNRDEQVLRASAIEPKNYNFNNKNVVFPKDPKAGGTWFAVDEYSNVVVLLNGADKKHLFKESYRKSRGLIVLELISATSPLMFWQTLDLENIEPFTIVLFENHKLYQLQWNEIAKSNIALDVNQSYIWSSATLYSEEIRKNRAEWFTDFLNTNSKITAKEMLDFHRYTQPDNAENGLVINRNNFLKTLSITQAVVEKNKVAMDYVDLQSEKKYATTFVTV